MLNHRDMLLLGRQAEIRYYLELFFYIAETTPESAVIVINASNSFSTKNKINFHNHVQETETDLFMSNIYDSNFFYPNS